MDSVTCLNSLRDTLRSYLTDPYSTAKGSSRETNTWVWANEPHSTFKYPQIEIIKEDNPTDVISIGSAYWEHEQVFCNVWFYTKNGFKISVNSANGTVTSATANTLTDNTETLTTDSLKGKTVKITGGTGIGQERVILSNTSTTLTVSSNWTLNPSTDSTYAIVTDYSNAQLVEYYLGQIKQVLKSKFSTLVCLGARDYKHINTTKIEYDPDTQLYYAAVTLRVRFFTQ